MFGSASAKETTLSLPSRQPELGRKCCFFPPPCLDPLTGSFNTVLHFWAIYVIQSKIKIRGISVLKCGKKGGFAFVYFPSRSEEASNVSAQEVVITTGPGLSFSAGGSQI